jgi:hypothetical protein
MKLIHPANSNILQQLSALSGYSRPGSALSYSYGRRKQRSGKCIFLRQRQSLQFCYKSNK